MRGSCDLGRGIRWLMHGDIRNPLQLVSFLLSHACVYVLCIHFILWVPGLSLPHCVPASYISFLTFCFCFCRVLFRFLPFLPCFCFYAFVEASWCRYSSDMFLSSRPRAELATANKPFLTFFPLTGGCSEGVYSSDVSLNSIMVGAMTVRVGDMAAKSEPERGDVAAPLPLLRAKRVTIQRRWKKKYAKKNEKEGPLYAKKRVTILSTPASDSELRPRRSSIGVRLAYTDPSDERQRAPSTPQQWGQPSLYRSFRRAASSTVQTTLGSI